MQLLLPLFPSFFFHSAQAPRGPGPPHYPEFTMTLI